MSSHTFRLPVSPEVLDSMSSDQQVVVVSFFGKSPYLSKGCKTSVMDEALGRQIFCPSILESMCTNANTTCEISGFWDAKQKVVYLQLTGMFDIHGLIRVYEELASDFKNKGFLTVWARLRHNYAQALLVLFSLSHVLVCSHPAPTFDASYIRLFRALDTVRPKIQGSLGEVLSGISGVSKDWIQHGRLCTPRLLFLFQRCPSVFKDTKYLEAHSASSKKTLTIKRREHAMEDQIYHVLRKNRIISKSSNNSLFAIPANQEFVFMQVNNEVSQDWRTELVDSVIHLCVDPPHGNESSEELTFHSLSFLSEMSANGHTFKSFLRQHIDQAFVKGFDDNVGRHSTPSHFEVPKLSLWLEVAGKVFDYLVGSEKLSSPIPNHNTGLKTLYGLLDTDIKFSESRCGKVLPLAIATYQENLPAHYTREYHEGRLAHALSVFAVHARGPLFEEYARQLEEECETHWKAGRQMCQVLSLTGHPCTKPLHRGGGDGAGGGELLEEAGRDLSQLPFSEHCSGVRYVSACNCGRKQGPRDDPFNMRVANHDFYLVLGKECGCCDLESISFPVFTPSTTDFRAAQLFKGKKIGAVASKGANDNRDLESTTPQGNTQGFCFGYVSGQSASSDLITEETNNLTLPRNESEADGSNSAIVIRVSDSDTDSFKEKGLVRQPSTTEYLPGMLHSESPPGLLPQFPSWSLVCLGPSSLYSHNLGLQEQQQAGLMPGSAFLLPWDLTVRLEHQFDRTNAWPTVGDAAFTRGNKPTELQRPRKTKRDAPEFVVKIFVGVEYECPRGHRFMCSAPDKVLKTSGAGLVKDNGNKITAHDMPLYFPCPCKNSKPLIGQLIRVHVVTPKAPVHVTLNPRVQPAPAPCPTFCPGNDKPIRLSQSAYWVLRLPYVYAGDHGPYIAPKEPVPASYGKLLAGMYGIMELALHEK